MTSPQQPKSPLPRRTKSLLYFAGATMIGAVVLFMPDQSYTSRWLRYADKLREGGIPLTYEEIEAQRTVIPDEVNGALVIKELAEQLKLVGENRWASDLYEITPGHERGTINFFGGISRDVVESERPFVEKQADLLEGLERLRGMPSGRFDTDLSVPVMKRDLPELSLVRTASKLLYLHTSIKLIDGDIGGAINTVVLQAHLGGVLDEHPSVTGRLHQVSVEARATRSIENILRLSELDDPSLLKLIDLVDKRQRSVTAKWVFLGLRAFWVSVCSDIVESKHTKSKVLIDPDNSKMVSSLSEMIIRANQMRGVEMLTWLVEAGDDLTALRKAGMRHDEVVVSGGGRGAAEVLIRRLMPSASAIVSFHIRGVARWTCARVALSSERFRLATGRFPESLDELVPEFLDSVPLDPFDGQPLRLAVTDEGIIIYSIDEGMVDDRGAVVPLDNHSRPRDVGFRLLAPEHRGLLLIDDLPTDDED